MRRSRHTDSEIAVLLREAERGVAIGAICESARVSVGTFYRWRRRLGGLPAPAVERLRHIEEENGRLRAQIAKLTTKGGPTAAIHHSVDVSRNLPADGTARGPAPTAHRGYDVATGRFAFVRSTH